MAIRTIIVDDQRLLRQCFQEALDQAPEIEVVATAADGQEALLLIEKHKPDIVLMDLAMPNLDGVGAAKLISGRVENTKILMLSHHDDANRVGTAMKAGVAGFISKDVDLEELVRIIKAVHAAESISSPFLADQRIASGGDLSRYHLTPREVQALKLLVLGHNNSEIAETLCVSEQTVKKEFVTIFERLGVRNRTQAAVKGVQLGLLDLLT